MTYVRPFLLLSPTFCRPKRLFWQPVSSLSTNHNTNPFVFFLSRSSGFFVFSGTYLRTLEASKKHSEATNSSCRSTYLRWSLCDYVGLKPSPINKQYIHTSHINNNNSESQYHQSFLIVRGFYSFILLSQRSYLVILMKHDIFFSPSCRQLSIFQSINCPVCPILGLENEECHNSLLEGFMTCCSLRQN
jgi:hypothetical protein